MLTVSNLNPQPHFLGYCLYNASDCAATQLLLDILLPKVEADPYAKWLYEFEMQLLAPAMVVGMRGLRVDEPKALELVKTFETECATLSDEARHLINTTLCEQWQAFKLSSAHQVKAALYGPDNISPCPACGWTNVVETVPAHSRLEVDEAGEYVRYKSGSKKGLVKSKELKQRTHICHEPHTYPGYNIKPYINRTTKLPTIDKDALGKLINRESEDSPAGTLAQLRLDFKAREKQKGFLKAPRSPNGYYPYSLNVGATETLRFSSDTNIFGEGSGSQNQDKRIEVVFTANPGFTLMERDLKSAENFALYHYLADEQAIQLVTSKFDLHSLRAQSAFPEYDWPDDPASHKALAENTLLFDNLKLRDVGKKVGHSLERFGTHHTIARSCKIKLWQAEEVVSKVKAGLPTMFAKLEEFKYSLRYREYVEVEMGWGRWRFPVIENPYEDDCAREMISQVLQSMVVMTAAKGFLAIYNDLDEKHPSRGVAPFELLRNKHDANEWQVRGQDVTLYDDACKARMEFPSTLHNGLTLTIPTSLAKCKYLPLEV